MTASPVSKTIRTSPGGLAESAPNEASANGTHSASAPLATSSASAAVLAPSAPAGARTQTRNHRSAGCRAATASPGASV